MSTGISQEKTYTIEEFMALADENQRFELVNGKLEEMSPTGKNHGRITMKLSGYLFTFIDGHDLGYSFAAETFFVLDPAGPTLRAPDFMFVKKGRLKAEGDGPVEVAPDLAVEVISPTDRLGAARNKAGEYLKAGVRLVWLVNPRNKTVEVFRTGLEKPLTLQAQDFLDGEDVVPGFRLPVQLIFE